MSSIPSPKKLDLNKALDLSSFTPVPNEIDRLPDKVLIEKLAQKADKCLSDGLAKYPYRCFDFTEESVEGEILHHTDSRLKVPSCAEKLFEGAYIDDIKESVARYIFSHIVGYDAYFDCPCIVIRDKLDRVVDIVKYRPCRDEYANPPKYLYEKSANKPPNRGKHFLYLFQVEMERLIQKYDYAFVGEGLKNTVNALIRSVPFVSIESASNAGNRKLVEYVQKLYRKGIRIYGAMDGDKAGEEAFLTLKKALGISFENLIDFNSGIDFTDYLRKEKL